MSSDKRFRELTDDLIKEPNHKKGNWRVGEKKELSYDSYMQISQIMYDQKKMLLTMKSELDAKDELLREAIEMIRKGSLFNRTQDQHDFLNKPEIKKLKNQT